jgi:hypothetical protein
MSGLRCDHKFVDSTRCLKCGWKPWEPNKTPLMPADPRPRAPLETMSEARFAALLDGLGAWSPRVKEAVYREVDAQREARATAAQQLEMKTAEVEVLRGVGCRADGDGPCGVCLKCAHATAYAEGLQAALAIVRRRAGDDDDAVTSLIGCWNDIERALRDTPAPRRRGRTRLPRRRFVARSTARTSPTSKPLPLKCAGRRWRRRSAWCARSITSCRSTQRSQTQRGRTYRLPLEPS